MTPNRSAVNVNGTDYCWPLRPVVMTGPELLRGDTISAKFAAAGAKVVSITAKDKLPKQLAKGLDVSQGHVSFSAEFAERCASAVNHDLSGPKGKRLRTHGGVSETKVPFILSHPLNDAYKAKAASQPLKSYQLFDYAINGTL